MLTKDADTNVESRPENGGFLSNARMALNRWGSRHDPGLIAFRRAARAAIVVPIVFFAIDRFVHNTTFTSFVVFGSLATLFLVGFSGSRRDQLVEAGGMLLFELILVCLGTAASRYLWLAVPLTALVTFAILFLSILKPSVSKTVTSILVSFIIPITTPASFHAIPDRLLAWSFAGGVSLIAIISLWPVTSAGPKDEVTPRAILRIIRNIKAEIERYPERYEKRLKHALRTTIAVSAAVLIANLLNTQHAYWVILGTLAVLCSSSVNTKQNVINALIGTAIGIVIASGLIALIGTETAACWALLPCAILFSGIAPAAISFMAGQIGFTTLLLLISNITTPIGWRVGLIRLEDILIGCVVSVLVGWLFWPRDLVPAH